MKIVSIIRAPFSCFGRRSASPLCDAGMRGMSQHVAPHPNPLPERERGTAAFSLIESLVIISVIAILGSASLVALPAARAHQQLISDTELISSLLLDSKERALNQVRPEDCLPDSANPQSKERAGCSDVGIVISNNSITQFADTNENTLYGAGDYVIVSHKMSTKGSGELDQVQLLFRSIPPSVEAYANGEPMKPEDFANITLTASNGETRVLHIQRFGTVDIQ